jgi:hypothetical protein
MRTVRHFSVVVVLSFLVASAAGQSENQKGGQQTWYFAVSGDSRNCGDIVMPAIAADAAKHRVLFYWHLGDLRAIYGADQDFVAENTIKGQPTDLADYEARAWDDFTDNQIKTWGDTPFYLGIGNHEVTPPKSRAAFIEKFHAYLDRPDIREQRLKDDPKATEPRAYFHWMRDGIDFIYLDNATSDQFGPEQIKWIEGVLNRDRKDESVRTIVVGMHEALPESISANHSMNEYPSGTETGRRVYQMLLRIQNDSHKLVYVLASHSHFYLENIYDTAHWRDPANGGVVLPGWIVGTAGAVRYPLPAGVTHGPDAREHVYGYLTGTVKPAGTIDFAFHQLDEAELQAARGSDYVADDVSFCAAQNPDSKMLGATRPEPITCEEALLR